MTIMPNFTRIHFIITGLLILMSSPSLSAQSMDALESLTQPQRYETRRESSSNPDLHKNGDARSIKPGETLVLGKLEGPGMITHIWNTVGAIDPFYGRSLVLRMYWDGAKKPSVQVPLGDFFGVGHGAMIDFTSLPVAVTSHGRARNCFWKMPFLKSALITVTNESTEHKVDSFYYYLDWRKYDSLPADTRLFHAQYRQAMPATPGDYTLLETTGAGHYVGTVYSGQQVELGWFGEGDDRFYIDGEATPSLRGTGTEDYFGDAWGFRAFATPYYGVSLWEGYFPGDRFTTYRWHIEDPISFSKSLKVSIEHKGSIFTDSAVHLGQFIERPDWISSVAFWYQSPAHEIKAVLPPATERIAPYRFLTPDNLTMRAVPDISLSSSDEGINYVPMTPNARLELDFEITEAGRYRIDAVIIRSLFTAKFQIALDGKAIGGVRDFYQTGSDPVWESLDLHNLDIGTHTLSFEGRGTSPHVRSSLPQTHTLTIGTITLLRLEDMQGYHEAMKKELEKRKK